MSNTNSVDCTAEDYLEYWLDGCDTSFITSDCGAEVRIARSEGDTGFEVSIDSQIMTRSDIKELRKFLKQVLADDKDPAGFRLR